LEGLTDDTANDKTANDKTANDKTVNSKTVNSKPVNSKEEGARHQFQSIQRIKQLPDYLQIWPGHRAGSACGKALGAVPSTTLGYEKLFNPAFQFNDEERFVAWLLADQPEIPRYFAEMKQVNKAGPALLATLPAPTRITRRDLDERIAAGELVIDLRPAADYRRAFVPGTINIPQTGGNFSTYVGWFIDYNRPLTLIVPDVAEVGELLGNLRAIGVDQIAGYAGPDVITADSEAMPIISAQEVAARKPANGLVIVDVRGRSEFREQHIAGARNIPLGFLPQSLDQLSHDDTIILHCSSGYRSQIAASLLRAKGFDNAIGLHDSKEQWSKLLDTVTGG
jgi:hydroxyacylglutathione hydrolase